ncbi:MHS family alpha-ketoglutarate permease-like MFS transporter [Propionibacteriaceae bacterium ES.041]|uniref:Alpha-ketoglutarate permease n=1 Tax=Enemella evansiae TaxID=2016499 RepID=A0A255GT89_9ACTN|nr:MFS transporter [Enemella evansiae]PFG68907.1 MHS family alpha-ketoglutarate permease-like MFS transporter [Propionibacteriaceae bacterium ES.041]OYN96981.1 alpha-ketoglutarate transporter [Enemella evansiae]OYO00586.1 alpha-ketoglutarate transporter [Enemella evansiae]OYO06177.1 alpha-ketoglutarate transporter [Enemella evansiae]OYO17683.1 alpha-ketoglutarate transporter [Enemella evansiae]
MTSATTPSTNAPTSTARAIGNTIKGSLGNLVEWYDVYTYTVFATYFESSFFDPADKNSQIYVYAVFAVTFVMRPVGSWYFGRFADRHGRRTALTISVSVMAAASFVIACLPTRDTIGVWAAVLLMFCRLIQGFATGGEYGTSATYMSEAATRERRGFFSSFQYVTLVGGHVLSQFTLLVLTYTMSQEALREWGWRIPFAIGGVAALIVFWLRRTMDESLSSEYLAEVKAGGDRSSGSLWELLVNYWRPLLLCFLITMGGTVAFYTYSVNAPAIVKATFKNSPTTATWLNLLGLIFLMCLQPLGGLLSDKVGRKPLLVGFGIGGLFWTYVLITFLPTTTNPVMSFLLVAVAYIILTGYTSINAIVKAELFPAHIRALGVGLGYGLANSAFGGTAPLIYQWFKSKDMVPIFIVYVTIAIAISLVVYIVFLKNKDETHLDREQGHAYDRTRV